MTKHFLFKTLSFTLLLVLTTATTWLIKLILHLRQVQYPPPESFIIVPTVDVWVERQENHDLLIRWRVESHTVRLYIGSHPTAIERDKPLAEVSGKNELLIKGVDPTARHYFELLFEGGESDGERVIVSERILPLEGASNLRDLGGYRTKDGRRTKWGQIYRSSELSTLTDDDFDYLLNLGIKITCDLRTQEEIAKQANRLPQGLPSLHFPIYKEFPIRRHEFFLNLHRLEEMWTKGYTDMMIDQKAHAFGDILRFLADANNLPLLLHCSAGKDRTGILLALLLLLLGVPEETVIADYTLSNLYYDTLRQKMANDMKPLRRLRITDQHLQPIFVANPATMRTSIDHIQQKYGSVARYLRDAAGVEDEVIARLKENLLD